MPNSQKGFVLPLVIAIIAILAIGGGVLVYENNKVEVPNSVSTTTTPIVGGDKDEHGCIGSAGYSWCAVKDKCLRVWEEKCEVTTTQPTSTSSYSCQTDTDCREISCPATGGFAHEKCVQNKCTISDEVRAKCSGTIN
jgi:Tfp pilus assembly major pilin PilA